MTRHVQLTSRDQFVKAGEAYFSPDGAWIIFQAVPHPPEGREPDPFYSMYVARLVRDIQGRITGLQMPIVISPAGSANTCGWFHPSLPGVVLLGSTVDRPATDQASGFRVRDRKYMWMFPDEMDVCTRLVPQIAPPAISALWADDKRATTVVPLFSRPSYDAECSYSRDGRFVLYAHVRSEKTQGRADADIWVYDTQTQRHRVLVSAGGYDGGPFFSPDGKRICYRSDRKLNDLLQLFVANLTFDADGVPVGIEGEHQVTDNEHVNWAPYWHPNGQFLVYGTSEVGHDNYEVFAALVDEATLKAGAPPRTRITNASGADVLPVFEATGQWMMWTAQRGPMATGEQKPSSQLWAAEFNGASLFPLPSDGASR